MIFQVKHAKKKFGGANFFKILATIFFIFLLIFLFSISNSGRSLMADIFSPLFRTGNFFYGSLSLTPNFFSDRVKLAEENKILSNEIENLRLSIIDYESVKYENQKLRQELGLKPIGNFITAVVLAKPPQIPLDSLFIDKGTNDDLKKEDLVFVGDRILVGKIVEVNKNKAKIALNSFAGSVSYGVIGRTEESLEVKGIGGGGLESKVPIDFNVKVGDKIMVNNSATYLIATVGIIEEDRSSGFKKILMSLPIDISKINIVYIKININD